MGLSLVFRIFYNSFFAILSILLLGLILITPANILQHTFANGEKFDPLLVFLCYGGTIVLVLLAYGFELWTTRQYLAAIPRSSVEKGFMNKKARDMIAADLRRSMAIGWASRPHPPSPVVTAANNEPALTRAQASDVGQETEIERKEVSSGCLKRRGRQHERRDDTRLALPPPLPEWRDIVHAGWSSPYSPDIPNLRFMTVIIELPNLIEARAVSLVPPNPNSNNHPPLPDLGAVDLLQRPSNMGLRDWMGELTALGIMSSPNITGTFLASYENARFSGKYLTEEQFHTLMNQFSELLRSMKPLSPSLLGADASSETTETTGSDIDDDAASSTPTDATPSIRSMPSFSSLSRSISSHSDTGSHGTIRTAPSRRPGTVASMRTASRQGEFSTAPGTPRSRKRGLEKMTSINSFAQSRAPYTPGTAATSSSSSMSLGTSSQNSVIRLKAAGEDVQSPEAPHTMAAQATV